MLKTIKLDKEKSVTLSNNAAWTMEYMEQFGHDILPDIMPVLAAVSNIVVGMAESLDGAGEKIEFKDVTKMLATLSGGSLSDAFVELSGLRFVDLINITWAMAKAADEDIPDPKTWVREFGTFPVDVIVPEVLGLALEGMASAKNLKRLRNAVNKIRTNLEPSSSTTSSSQDSKED
jgi:hypothetical protein